MAANGSRSTQHTQTHTHRQARVHGHYTHTNSTKSNRSAQLLSGTRTHAHTHTANTQRCLVVNASSQRGRMNPEKHNKTRRSTQLNAAAERRTPTPTPTATQLRERTCVVHSLLAWCDRTKTLSLSLSLSLFICFGFFFLLALKTNIQSVSVLVFRADCSFQTVCAWAAIDCRNLRSIDRMSFIATTSPLATTHKAKHNGTESAIMVNGNYMKCLKTHSMDIIK